MIVRASGRYLQGFSFAAKLLSLFCFAFFCVQKAAFAQEFGSYAEHPSTLKFIDALVAEEGFDRDYLIQLFARVEYRKASVAKTQAPAEQMSWERYRPILVNPQRVKQGVEFWYAHREELQRAEEVYGVPAEIVVALMGVETRYGRVIGRTRVVDALATLAFDYPSEDGGRGLPYFRREMRHLLLLARDQSFEPLALKGSYAGAMGYVQFMPSSYRAYGVDFDDDGSIDIWNNWSDAIGSAANYLKRNGWRRGEPIAYPVQVEGDVYRPFVVKSKSDLKPSISLARWNALGVTPMPDEASDKLATLMVLQTSEGEVFWLGRHNLYVISRYNPSAHYALATFQLADAIKQALNP